MNMNRSSNLAVGLLLFSAMLIACVPSSISEEQSLFSLNIPTCNATLIPGDHLTVPFFLNDTGAGKPTVTLQTAWEDETPDGIHCSVHPSTGAIPFSGVLFINSTTLADPGSYILLVTAESENTSQVQEISLTVGTDLTVTFLTDAACYQQGQLVHVVGNATTLDGSLVTTADVTVSLISQQRARSFQTSLLNGSFSFEYPISYGDEAGSWIVQARVVDVRGHVGVQSLPINVSVPPDIIRYTIDFFSPPNNAILRRGDTFSISVYVSEDSRNVQNATTTCILSPLISFPLLEYAPGNYRQNYTIPWDAPVGSLWFTVESMKNTSGSFRAGGSSLSVVVQPATLQLTVVAPSSMQFTPNTLTPIQIKVRYPDATAMDTGEVSVYTPTGTVTLRNEGSGIYAADLSFPAQEKGSQIIEIHAQDPYGNTGVIKKIALVAPAVSSATAFVSYLPLLTASVCIIIGVLVTRRLYRFQHLKSIQDEMAETKKLQEETGRKYYVDGSISKEVYDTLMYEHVQRYSQLQKEERRISHNKK
jgi:hypothetical protein